VTRVLCVALVLAAAGVDCASAAEPALVDLMRELASVPRARARFTETKHVALLKAPLTLTGTLSYERPDRLEKHVLAPYDERIAIAGTQVTVDNNTRGRTQNVSVASNPTLLALVESLRATLAGDLAALERHFEVTLERKADQWTIALVPREPGTLALITRISLTGSGNQLRRIDIDEAGGDRSEMSIQDDTR
jgi:outer membrane lipoprotein-sorting protein